MSDNIIIRITGESDLDKVNQDLQHLEDTEKDIRQEMIRTQAEYQKQVALIQQNVKGREAQVAAIDKLQKKHTEYQRNLDAEQKKVKTSMDQYNNALKGVNDTVTKGAVSTPKLTTQIRLLKDELAKMEAAGISPTSKAFVDMSVKTAKLEDQMGDTARRVRILASDTKELDTAISLGSGLAGGFTAATSAAALLGGESEELQKAFFKVQAVMSILNGVNQVAIALNKDSAARVVIGTFVTSNNTIAKVKNYAATKVQAASTAIETAIIGKGVVAKGAATVAQWALNAAMYAFPLIAIIAGLAALVTGIVMWSKHNRDAKKTQEELTKSIQETSKAIDKNKDVLDANVGYMVAASKSKDQIRAYELTKLRENLAAAQAENKKQEDAYNKASKREKKNLQEGLDASKALVEESFKAIGAIKTRYKTEDIQSTKDAERAKTDAEKKAAAQRIEQLKKMKADELKIFIETQNAIDSYLNKQTDEYKRYLLTQQTAFENLKKADIKDEEAFFVSWLTLLQRRKDLGLITEKEYQDKKYDYILKSNANEETLSQAQHERDKARRAEELEEIQRQEELKQQIIQATFDVVAAAGNLYFDGKKQQLDEELEALQRNYTTDAEAARNNANLKLISEQELQRKTLEIKQKQAKADKAQAIFNIALSTAQAIMAFLASGNIAGSIGAGIIGALQLAAVASKPLPRYAKGKSAGGKGHFATVGEQGAETMWIPDGAAVIPHGRKMDYSTFADFNIPNIPNLGDRYIRGGEIDYRKLGKAVADNVKIPTPKPVTVNVDKNGVTTFDGLRTARYLNKKYTGEWN